ncbi:hypothetical protein [Neisseria shayeganii]|uniref:Uncharacterized protein n=1 Tax=Neisseria shayeganii 871 TaxID=1032488 RepID=G4CIH8_9NEIS|nr:hypothetical protein [Neisseria shayeganii]EGY52372.1 hypothetical protein HMPREF9371_1361 [Neisseria shayeganii 871]
MDLTELLAGKIANADCLRLIERDRAGFSAAETELLAEILRDHSFDVVQQQALAQAVSQQARFDPDALHYEEDDEDTTAICPHCLNPPVPPLRDYLMWRQQQARS